MRKHFREIHLVEFIFLIKYCSIYYQVQSAISVLKHVRRLVNTYVQEKTVVNRKVLPNQKDSVQGKRSDTHEAEQETENWKTVSINACRCLQHVAKAEENRMRVRGQNRMSTMKTLINKPYTLANFDCRSLVVSKYK